VCGNLGTACCPPATSGGAATCLGEGSCAGKACGCVLEYLPVYGGSEALVRLTDGTLQKVFDSNSNSQLNGIYQPVSNAAGKLKVGSGASQIALSGYNSTYGPIGCAIDTTGAVWCFPLRDSIADSTYIGNGGQPGQAVSQAQQVWASVDGTTKLTGVTQIAGGQNTSYPFFCAVGAGGGVWCWGYNYYGQLGTGDNATPYSYANPVKTSISGTLSGVAEVRPGFNATCARKTDGTVWCWGTDSNGELGVAPSTYQGTPTGGSLYAVQVVITGTATATKLAIGPSYTFCAVMSDTSALCWGHNYYGEAGLPTTGNPTVTPNSILQAAGGSPLTGVVDLVDSSGWTMCARLNLANNPVYCWGEFANNSPYPVAAKDNASAPITGIVSPLYGNYEAYISYVDRNAQVDSDGTIPTAQPNCSMLGQ
jgi:hypothetical protein